MIDRIDETINSTAVDQVRWIWLIGLKSISGDYDLYDASSKRMCYELRKLANMIEKAVAVKATVSLFRLLFLQALFKYLISWFQLYVYI